MSENVTISKNLKIPKESEIFEIFFLFLQEKEKEKNKLCHSRTLVFNQPTPFQIPWAGTRSVTEEDKRTDKQKSLCLILDS